MGTNVQAMLNTGNSIEICDAAPSQNSHVDIPLKDLAPIVVEVLRRDLLNSRETNLVLDAALEALYRQEQGIGDGVN